MRIVLVGPSVAQRGGIASVVHGLNQYMLENNESVVVVPTTVDGSSWFRLIVFVRAWLFIIRVSVFRRADIVHLHMSSQGSCLRKLLLGLTCWVFRTPFIIHLHGSEFKVFYGCELGAIGRKIVRFTFARATRVIALSSTWQAWMKEEMGLKNVTVVLNGVPSLSIQKYKDPKPTVLFLGRLGARKGTDDLIKSIRIISKQLPDVALELGGDGDIENYRQLAADLPNVRFLGWVDDAGRREALARATVYCLPSWNEGLPMSVLEAMSAGLPVVSTPVGGIPEAVVEGETGLLVQPGDVQGLTNALSKLLLNPDMASIMGHNGQIRHREKFSTEAMGKSCLEVYEECLKH